MSCQASPAMTRNPPCQLLMLVSSRRRVRTCIHHLMAARCLSMLQRIPRRAPNGQPRNTGTFQALKLRVQIQQSNLESLLLMCEFMNLPTGFCKGGRDRPGFGCDTVFQKLRCNNLYIAVQFETVQYLFCNSEFLISRLEKAKQPLLSRRGAL
jgi:hypothetical protein